MIRLSLLFLIWVALPTRGHAQTEPVYTGDSLYFLLPSDSVVLYTDQRSGHLLFDHYLAPRQTLYGAASFYGLSVDELYHLNPPLRAGYATGDKVSVTIPKQLLRESFSADSIAWFVPVRYALGPGETLFGLSRRTLGMADEGRLLRLNPGLEASGLKKGQQLTIGYLRIDGIPEEAQGEVEDYYVQLNRGLRELWNTRTAGKKMYSKNGKAAWTSGGDKNRFMALHRTAPIGSLIELDDPRSRKTLYAKVVGRIPEERFDRSVIVVVSPLLVKAFGVRDQNFYVRTRHF